MTRILYPGKIEPILTPAQQPERVSEDKFHFPWSEPVRTKPGLLAHLQQFQPYDETARFPEVVSEDRWHQPWSEPSVKQGAGLLAANQQFLAETLVQFQPRDSVAWFNPLSEPSVKKFYLNAALQQFLAQSESAQFPESITEDRWHQPWSEPQIKKFYLNTALQQFIAYSESAQFPENVTEDRWHQPWSNPQILAPQRTAQFQDLFWQPNTPVAGVIFGYFNAFSEPVRQKLGLGANLQQFLAYSESAQFPESVTEDRWHVPWSDPVKVPLRTAQFQDLFWPSTPVAAVPSFGYYTWLSEPVRQKSGLISALQQFLAYSESAQFPETVSEDRWHVPWSDPVRVLPRAPHFNDFFFGSQNPAVSFSYYNWLSEPVRVAPRISSNPPDFFYGSQSPLVSFSYYNWLSEPVRSLPRTTQFQDFAFGTQSPIIPSFGYYNWLAEPVRVAARVQGPPDYFNQPFPITAVTVPFGFWGALSEPTRRPPQQYPYSFQDGISPIIPSFGYYNWLSEPVRQAARLLPGIQSINQDFFIPIIPSFGYFNAFSVPTLRTPQFEVIPSAFLNPNPPLANTMQLSATEQGDSFLNSLLLLYNKTFAVVSIITTPQPPPGSPVGIISRS